MTSQQSQRPQKGLNLGGWLVLEKWMTPSVFDGTTVENEFELSQAEGGRERILRHRETFITEADIAWIAQTGIKVLRLPIGYWALGDATPYISARKQLDWLMETAQRHGLKVLIDLHAAPGAQNDSAHSGSGKPGGVAWYEQKNRQATSNILEQLARDYGQHPALWGVEILNEPLVKNPWQYLLLWRWTRQTVTRLRQLLPAGVHVIASDCYQPLLWSGQIKGAHLDIHHYQCFKKQDVAAESYTYHQELLARKVKEYQRYAQQQPVIIGEWSAVLPPKTSKPETEAAFCREQLAAYAQVDAWFFWSYKTEHTGGWNFRDCYERGWFKDML